MPSSAHQTVEPAASDGSAGGGASSAGVAPAAAAPSHASVWSALVKARLSALVLLTAAVGFAVAPEAQGPEGFLWGRMGWMCLGTGLAAASAAMLNQVWERHRDALMHRTAQRPLPAGHARPLTVLLVGIAIGYAGCAVLGVMVNLLSAWLALANILIYVLLYTPLKPRTTFNTLVGAVTGALPPMIGWVGATNHIDPGAWALFGLLFVWQIPHFLALAWMYRADYARGGFAMLPSLDTQGHATAQACLLTSLLLVPTGLLVTITGVAGVAYAVVAALLGLGMTYFAARFAMQRTDRAARSLFLASLAYLPLLMAAMVLDRGNPFGPPPLAPGQHEIVIEVPAHAASN